MWNPSDCWNLGAGRFPGLRYPHIVGQKKPNGSGPRDMHGNVRERCSDWYREKVASGRDPIGPATGSDRVLRGGSWITGVSCCRAADRYYFSPDFRHDDAGFRVAGVSSSECDPGNRNNNLGFRVAEAHSRCGDTGRNRSLSGPSRSSGVAKSTRTSPGAGSSLLRLGLERDTGCL